MAARQRAAEFQRVAEMQRAAEMQVCWIASSLRLAFEGMPICAARLHVANIAQQMYSLPRSRAVQEASCSEANSMSGRCWQPLPTMGLCLDGVSLQGPRDM